MEGERMVKIVFKKPRMMKKAIWKTNVKMA
jgi:hypothetical protein